MMTQDLGFAGLPLGHLKDVALSYISFLAATSLLKNKINFFFIILGTDTVMLFLSALFLTLIPFVFKNTFILCV